MHSHLVIGCITELLHYNDDRREWTKWESESMEICQEESHKFEAKLKELERENYILKERVKDFTEGRYG